MEKEKEKETLFALEDTNPEAKGEEAVFEALFEEQETGKPHRVFKYNHEERELDAEAVEKLAEDLGWDAEMLITNLQKGAHYDTQMERMKKDPARTAVEQFAKQRGVTVEEAAAAFERQRAAHMLEAAMEEVAAAYPDISKEAAKELALYRAKEMGEGETLVDEAQEKEEKELDLWKALFLREPDLNAAALPEEVLGCRERGETPCEAYYRYMWMQLAAEKAQRDKKEMANAKTAGTMQMKGAAQEYDAFADAFGAALRGM